MYFNRMLGNELAKVKDLNLATEGFLGAVELVGKNFCEERQIRNRKKHPNIYHIIPDMDSSVRY